MLSEEQVHEMQAWLGAARSWSQTAQAMVGAATELTTASRSLASRLAEGPPPSLAADDRDHAGSTLEAQLRLLADTVEDEGLELRDRYLTTQAELEVYATLLD
jgi:hypothetical protein